MPAATGINAWSATLASSTITRDIKLRTDDCSPMITSVLGHLR